MAVTGLPRRVWLNKLKAAARKSTRCCSMTGTDRESATSPFQAPGPSTRLRPAFPTVPTGPTTKDAVLNQREMLGFDTLGSPTTLGRSAPPVRELSVPTVTVE